MRRSNFALRVPPTLLAEARKAADMTLWARKPLSSHSPALSRGAHSYYTVPTVERCLPSTSFGSRLLGRAMSRGQSSSITPSRATSFCSGLRACSSRLRQVGSSSGLNALIC